MVETIRELMEIESPSDDKQAVDHIASCLAAKFEQLGGRVLYHRCNEFGDSLQVDFAARDASSAKRKPVLLLGHYDTVYPLGTLAAMPCKIEKGRLRGPGVLDMKSGIALMLYAIEAVQAWHGELPRPVRVFLVSDEEVGSRSSRKITERLAKHSAGVLVLEPAAGRLTGVEARSINGRRLTVVADWFILAAGTLETTRLLLQLDELTDGRAFSECDSWVDTSATISRLRPGA